MTRIEDFLKLNKNRQIWTISKDQSVMKALILMSEKNIGAIIIVDNNDFQLHFYSLFFQAGFFVKKLQNNLTIRNL